MSSPGRGINVHAYPSAIRYETRMFKETASLEQAALFEEIWLVGTGDPDLPREEAMGPRRRIVRLDVASEKLGGSRLVRLLVIGEWWFRVWWRLRKVPVAVFSAHNLAALPLGIALKFFRGTRVVYATHELESERTGWSGLTVRLGRAIERLLIYRTDAVFVVSRAIAEWYQRAYPGLGIHVLRNFPLAKKALPRTGVAPVALKVKLGIPEDALLFLYQGVIGAGRRVDVLLKTFTSGKNGRHLLFLGFSDGSSDAERVHAATRTSKYVHFHPAVTADELLHYTAGADVGIYLIEAASLSYQLTVGNKVYEYLSAGIPVIGSDFPDVRLLLEEYDAGWLVPSDGSGFAEVVSSISVEAVRAMKRRLADVWPQLCWERQEASLVAVYAGLADGVRLREGLA